MKLRSTINKFANLKKDFIFLFFFKTTLYMWLPWKKDKQERQSHYKLVIKDRKGLKRIHLHADKIKNKRFLIHYQVAHK